MTTPGRSCLMLACCGIVGLFGCGDNAVKDVAAEPRSNAVQVSQGETSATLSPPEKPTMNPQPEVRLDRRVTAGTDGASFFVYHPADLQHRLTSPLAWTAYHFACRPEFEVGRLVAFDTGGDGGYSVRVTDGPLTDREKAWLANSWDFRLAVRHGRVYLDGGYALPSDDYFDDSDKHPDQWIELANGNYRVTVNSIEWYSEPGALDENEEATDKALASYVIQFTPVEDFDAIAVSSTPPILETSREWKAQPSTSFAEYDTYEEDEVQLGDREVVHVHKEVAPIPGFHIEIQGSNEFYEAFYGAKGNEVLPDRIEQLVIASSDELPCIGALVTPSGAGRSGNQPWTLHFHAKRLVTVRALDPTQPWPTGKAEPLDRPKSNVPAERLTALKQAFAGYAKSNESYRKTIRNPDFEVERVAALDSAAAVTTVLIHHVQMPVSTRLALLPLSDADRVARLIEMIEREN